METGTVYNFNPPTCVVTQIKNGLAQPKNNAGKTALSAERKGAGEKPAERQRSGFLPASWRNASRLRAERGWQPQEARRAAAAYVVHARATAMALLDEIGGNASVEAWMVHGVERSGTTLTGKAETLARVKERRGGVIGAERLNTTTP